MAIERGMNCSATLLASLRPRTAEMLAFVKELVTIEAGSYDATQVAKVGEVLGARWKSLGFAEKRQPLEGRGPDPRCRARPRPLDLPR